MVLGFPPGTEFFEFPPFVRASALSYGGKIFERLRVKRESLTGVEVHIGFCLYLFSAQSLRRRGVTDLKRSGDARSLWQFAFSKGRVE